MCIVLGPEVATVHKEINDGALIKLGESGKDVKRWLVAAHARPLLPVREILERLRVVRPPVCPLICGPLLRPAVSEAQRHASIDAEAFTEHGSNFGPGLPGTAK